MDLLERKIEQDMLRVDAQLKHTASAQNLSVSHKRAWLRPDAQSLAALKEALKDNPETASVTMSGVLITDTAYCFLGGEGQDENEIQTGFPKLTVGATEVEFEDSEDLFDAFDPSIPYKGYTISNGDSALSAWYMSAVDVVKKHLKSEGHKISTGQLLIEAETDSMFLSVKKEGHLPF